MRFFSSIGVRSWVLLAYLLTGVIPAASFFALRIYDAYLVRQTERQLIAQAVFVGERYREIALRQDDLSEFRPPTRADEHYVALEPKIEIENDILPPQPKLGECQPKSRLTDVERHRFEAWLKRSQIFVLSGIRILDERGCVVATSGSEYGAAMSELREVSTALGGEYASLVRERISEHTQRGWSIPQRSDYGAVRHGKMRVFIALPLFSDGRVFAVVRISRTSISAWSSLWRNRRWLIWAAIGWAFGGFLIVLFFSRVVGLPLRRLARAARRVEAGEDFDFQEGMWNVQEVVSLGASIKTMTASLQERAHYIENFLMEVSHELKTPMTGIYGASELLRDEWQTMSDEERRRFLSNLNTDAERMRHVVTEVLQLARIESTPRSTKSKSSLASIGALLSSRYPEVFVDDETQTIFRKSIVMVSEDDLHTIFRNLCDNAIQHGDGDIRLEVRRDGDLLVTISNDGEVSSKVREKMFERFFTTKRDEGGSGIGLSIVAALVHRSGGSIRSESTDGRTSIHLSLPFSG